MASYGSDFGLLAAWCKETGELQAVEDVTATTVENWMASRTDVAASTLQRNLASLSSLFAFLVQREIVPRNPIDLLERPRSHDPQPVCLTNEYLHQLLDAIDDAQHRAILLAMALLGLRRSEVLKLEIGDVDLANARLYVRDSRGHVTHTPHPWRASASGIQTTG